MLVLQTFSQLGQHEGDIAQGWAAVLRLPGMTEASVAIGQFGGFLRHRDTPKIIVRPQDEYPRWRFLKKNGGTLTHHPSHDHDLVLKAMVTTGDTKNTTKKPPFRSFRMNSWLFQEWKHDQKHTWLVVSNMKVSWDDYSQYMEKNKCSNPQPDTEHIFQSWGG